MQHTIRDEFIWARQGVAEPLRECGIERKALTTDPDNSADRTANSLFKDELKKVKLIKILDICYKVSRNIKKKMNNV